MVLAWKYCWCVILVARIQAFNVTVDNIAVFEDPHKSSSSSSSSRNTYFGYSVALQADGSGKSWIHVGAPKANDWELPGIDEPGVLYRCEIGSSCEKRKLYAPSNTNLDHAILGGSIAIRDNQLMVCGSNAHVIRLGYLFDMTGICYDLPGNGTRDEGASSLTWNSDPNARPETGANGFSVHAISRTSPVEFLVGAPLDRNGYIRRYKKTSNGWTRSTTSYAIKGSDVQSYGYAITSGYYFDKDIRVYVMGAPRGNDMFGEVLLQDFENKMSAEKQQHWTIYAKPGQIGEFFGASLATCKLTGDDKDELLVGAPLWSRNKDNEEEPDVGRVYIFTLDVDYGAKLKLLKTLEGEVVDGRFGSVITCLGDIDHDGYGDVAISAPHNGNGVVYVYNGNNDGLRDTYTQLIASPSNVRGFGFSISEPEDIDGNGFKDIAVGTFSGHVLVYRSKIIVRLNTSAESFTRVPGNDANKAYFRSRLCTSFIPVNPSGISWKVRNLLENDSRIAVTYDVNIDQENRGSVRHKTFSTTTRDNNDKLMMCEEINFAMNKISGKLWMNVSASLNVSGEDDGIFTIGSRDSLDKSFEYLMVVDRSESNHNVAKLLPDLTLCNDVKCRANLQVDLTSDLKDGNTYFIGTKPNIQLFIHVKNIGEEAYDTRTIISIPKPLTFLSSGSSNKCGICSTPFEGNTCVDCVIDDPLLTGNNKTIVLELDASRVTEGYGSLVIRTNTSTQSDDESRSRNIQTIEIKSRMDVKVGLKGETGTIHQYRKDSSDNILFAQEYEVVNSGKTLLERAVFTAYVPSNWREREFAKLKSTTSYINGTWVNLDCEESLETTVRNYFEGSSSFDQNTNRVSCNDPSVKCSSIECQLRSIKEVGSSIRIRLSFETNPSKLAFVSGNGTSVVFETSAKISNVIPKIAETNPNICDCTFGMQTIFMEPIAEPSNAVNWIIIVSILLGLLLLAILCFVLYKFGFFNRKKKADLEKLQGENQAPAKATEETALRDAVEIE